MSAHSRFATARRHRWVATVLAVVVVSLSACTPSRFISGWVPWWGATDGQRGFADSSVATMFSEVSPFWYSAQAPAGTPVLISSATALDSTVAAARARGLVVIPSVVDGTGKGEMAAILADDGRRAVHVQLIVDLVVAEGFDGIDLDYEGFAFTDGRATWPATQPNWVRFVDDLGAALHAQGKLLSVTIPPTWMDGVTERGYPVYAQQAIAASADRIRLMVYDWSVSSPGPISPMTWVNQVVAYSTARVPVAKLALGVPAYGRNWGQRRYATEICPAGSLATSAVQMESAAGLAAARQATPIRHSSGEMTFVYDQVVTGNRFAPLTPPIYVPPATTISQIPAAVGAAGGAAGGAPALRLNPPNSIVTCTVRHTVYYPDATTVRQHAQAAIDAEWSGIVIWALGYESTDVWNQLAAIAPQWPGGQPSGALHPAEITGSTVRLTGWAVDPEFDLPIAVRITIGAVSRVLLARTYRDDVAATFPGVGPYHGFNEVFTLAPGTHSACITVLPWAGEPQPLPCQQVIVT